MNTAESKNVIYYLLSHSAITCGVALSTTTFIQAFLVELGLSNSQIGIIGFVDSISLTIGSFFVVGIVSKIKNSARANAWSTLFYGFVPLLIVAITLVKKINPIYALFAICGAYAIQNLGLAFKQSIYTKVLVNFVSAGNLSRIISTSSVLGNLLGILTGSISATFMMIIFPYNFTVLFASALMLLIIGAVVSGRCREIYPDKQSSLKLEINPVKALLQLISIKQCRVVLICHLMRGIYSAAMYYIIVVAVKNINTNGAFLSYTFTISTIATMLAALMFGFLSKKLSVGNFYLIGTILSGISLVFAVITDNMLIFLILNFFVMFGNMLTDISVPIGIYKQFDSDMLGSITGARMFISFAGRAVFTMIMGFLLDLTSPWVLFLAAVLFQVFGAFLYWSYFERKALTTRES